MRSGAEEAAGDCSNAPPAAAMSTSAGMTRRRIEWAAGSARGGGLPREAQRLERGPPGAGCVAVWHHADRNIGLLLPLHRHAGGNFGEEPALEFLGRLEGAAADDERVRVEGVDHLIEEQAQRVGLHAENLATHVVAGFRHPAHALGSLAYFEFSKLMFRVLREEPRQQRLPYGGQRAEGFQVADPPAVAVRGDTFDSGDALIWNQHVPQLAAEPAAALDHVAADDHAATQPRADDGRYRRGLLRVLEDRPVPPQRAGV